MHNFRMDYDGEGDILEVVWEQGTSQKKTGVELSENIVLFTNSEYSVPLGLMFLSYSHLLKATTIELTGLGLLPEKQRQQVLDLLKTSCVARFLDVSPNGQTVLADPTIRSLAAA